jgi:hypothetical protein
LTIVAYPLRLDDALEERDHRPLALQLDDNAGERHARLPRGTSARILLGKGRAQVPAAQARDKSGRLPRTQKALERRPGPRHRSGHAVANSTPRASGFVSRH